MDESFHESKSYSKADLKKLMSRSNGPSLLQFFVQYLLLIGSAVGIVMFHDQEWWKFALSMFGVALFSMSMFAIGHETIHSTAFRSRALNLVVGLLATTPIFYTFEGFRQFHFAHHRYTHDPERDPEISIGGKPAPSVIGSLPMYIGWLTGLPLILFKIMTSIVGAIGFPAALWEKVMPFVPENRRTIVSWQARLVVLCHGALITYGFLREPAVFWIYLALVIGHAMLAFYLTTEHNGLPHEGSAVERTRSIRTNIFIRFLMWNMPYHAEHHAYPAIPWHKLPELKQLMGDEVIHTMNSYPEFHAKAGGSLLRGKVYKEE